jgi:Protein of unknown function (DUF2846)
MHRIGRRWFLIAALALAACAGQNPDLPAFASAQSSLSPPAPGTTRLYFYRLLEPYEIPSGTTVYLNGQATGYLRNGAVIYRDAKPGTYEMSVLSRGFYPHQFKTLTVAAGEVWYMRVESLLSLSCAGVKDSCRGDVFVVEIVDPTQARAEIASLGLDRG